MIFVADNSALGVLVAVGVLRGREQTLRRDIGRNLVERLSLDLGQLAHLGALADGYAYDDVAVLADL